MATTPPPYSSRDYRRQARDVRRAQKDQYRLQYAYLRRRPSFVGPALLIACGVIALLLETGHLTAATFWPWYARWWPALLILVGLGMLVEYSLDRRNPLGGRRSIGGVVWLIILLSLAGGAGHAALNLGSFGDALDNFGDHQDWMSMMGEEHAETHTLVQPIASNGSLSIDDARGDVQVAAADPGAPNEVRVEARQVVHANSDSVARRDLDATRAILTGHGADATLTAAGRDGAHVDLKVTVPSGIALVLRTAHGDAIVSGVHRNVDLTVAHGDVTVDNLGAALHVQMDHGDVTVHELAGDLSIDGRANDVLVSGVKGRSLLNGEFFGDTRLANVGSQVHFHSSRTDLDVPKLGGEMTLDSGNLRLVNPSGGIHLTTRSKDIEVTDLVGDAHIEDSNGDLNVSSTMPLGNLQLTDRTGSMVVTVPSNASFSVHGSANSSDDVTTDFVLSTQEGDGRKTLSGQVGQGGPHLELEADHGDLSLHRGSSRAAISEPSAPPTPPTPPAPPSPDKIKRLHASGAEPEPTVQ